MQGAFLNAAAITESIREAIDNAKIRNKNVAAAVCGHSVIVKKVSLPVMTRDELDEQIRWEAEQYIPFDVNEVNLDFQILDSADDQGQMDVLLVAAKKDLIDDYVQVISEAGLIPVAIDVAAFAVENAFEANYEVGKQETVALVNLGAQVVNITSSPAACRASRATSRPPATSTPRRSRRRCRSRSTRRSASSSAARAATARTWCPRKSSRRCRA